LLFRCRNRSLPFDANVLDLKHIERTSYIDWIQRLPLLCVFVPRLFARACAACCLDLLANTLNSPYAAMARCFLMGGGVSLGRAAGDVMEMLLARRRLAGYDYI
jgi:hypothetical protein